MAQRLIVVVTGSTGKQGGAVARSLLERGHKVRAVTRDPKIKSSRATSLANAGATLVGASLEDTAAITQGGRGNLQEMHPCHAIGPGASNKLGPELNGVIGGLAGSVAGYNYSRANKASGLTWSEDVIADYIRNPKAVVPGTKMTFAGLKNDQDVADLISYLKTFDPNGQPIH